MRLRWMVCSLALLWTSAEASAALAKEDTRTAPPPSSPGAQREVFAGQRLSEALLALQARGLALVFTSQLVGAQMTVLHTPQAAEPRAILDEILAPHGLRARTEADGLLVVVRVATALPPLAAIGGTIAVQVKSKNAIEHVRSATLLTIEPPGREVECAIDGRCVLSGLEPGSYSLEARARGFVTGSVDAVVVKSGGVVRLQIELQPEPFVQDEILIQASQLSLFHSEATAPFSIDRSEMDRVPHLGGDLFRALSLLPGIAANDVSAQFSIHGGRPDEVQILLDGQELYEPYHLKDYNGALSIVPAKDLAGAKLITGAFESSFGDRMGGVLDLTTLEPAIARRTTISLSSVDALVQSLGLFPGNRGSWLASGRRGFLDLAGKAIGTENPAFWDVFAKLELRLGERNLFWTHILSTSDDLDFEETSEGGFKRFQTDYDDRYAWLRHQGIVGNSLLVESGASRTEITRDRYGTETDEKGDFDVADRRALTIEELSQTWSLQQSPVHLLRWGWQLRRYDAEFDYRNFLDPDFVLAGSFAATRDETNLFRGDLRSRHTEAWATDRFSFADQLTIELGLRYDRHTLPDESLFSPRVSAAWSPGERNVFRASWGHFQQSQRPYELQIGDGETTLAAIERAEHWVVGWEQLFGKPDSPFRAMRVEYFRRQVRDPRVRFENALEQVNTLPEIEPDRIRIAPESSRAAGLELLLRGSLGPRLAWWLTYSHSTSTDRIDGRDVPRVYDQPNALSLNLNVPAGRHWNFNFAARARTGWPTTPVTVRTIEEDGETIVQPVLGSLYSERFKTYHRVDVRASRSWRVRNSELVLFFDIQNIYDRNNLAGFDVAIDDESGELVLTDEHWPGIFPSVGISWEF